MDNDLRRVFDQTRPSPAQKEAMLGRLLTLERKVKPMKKLNKLTVVGIAAALMVIACAAAVAPLSASPQMTFWRCGSYCRCGSS